MEMKFSRLSDRSESETAIVRNSSSSLDSTADQQRVTMTNEFQNMDSKNGQDSLTERAKRLLLLNWKFILLATSVVLLVIIFIAIIARPGSPKPTTPQVVPATGGDNELLEKQKQFEQSLQQLSDKLDQKYKLMEDKIQQKYQQLDEEINQKFDGKHEDTKTQMENKYEQLDTDLHVKYQKLDQQLKEKDNQLNDMNDKYDQLHQKLGKFEVLEKNLEDMQQKLQKKEAKIKELDIELKNVKNFNQELKTKLENATSERKEIEGNIQIQVSDNYSYMENFKNDIWLKLAKLEKALNMTVNEITSSKANHQQFADDAMKLMNELHESMNIDFQDPRGDGNITDFANKIKNATAEIETCINPVKLKIVSCEASSEKSRNTKCDLAIDGNLKARNAGWAWESRGSSGGAEWIKVKLDKPARITMTKILQRFEEAEALTKIRLDFEEYNSIERLKALSSTHWNSITLPHSTKSSWMKVALMEANSWGSNGLKEIRLYGCYI